MVFSDGSEALDSSGLGPRMTPFQNAVVEQKFGSYPPHAKRALLELRELIFETAETTAGVRGLEETLKWGEPAYLTTNKAGSTVRMDWKPRTPDRYALYFHCQTGLVDMFRSMFPDDFEFEGNRALFLRLDDPMPEDALRVCIAASLTYHLNKRR